MQSSRMASRGAYNSEMRTTIIALAFISGLCIGLYGQTKEENVISAKASCSVDFERWFENCLRAAPSGALFLSPEVLHTMSFSDNMPAALYSNQDGWIYVNRNGRVLI